MPYDFRKINTDSNGLVSKSSPSTGGGYNFTKGATKEELVNIQKQDLIKQGLPVSVRSNRAEPTMIGGMVRDTVMLGADVLANVRNAGRVVTGQEEKPVFKSNYLGDVKGLGKVDMTKSPFEKENLKTIIKSAATGAEIASWIAGGGEAKAVTKGLTKTVQLAAKKTFAETVSKQLPSWLKLGAGIGTSQTLGTQGREYADTGKPFDWTQAAKDITTATLLTPVAELGIRKLFGTNANKIIKARQAVRDAEIASNKVRIEAMPAGTKFDNFKPSKVGIMDNVLNPNAPKEVPKINVEQGARYVTPEVTPKNPLETRATKATTQGDFIGNEVAFMNRTKQEVTPSLMKKLEDTWNKMHPAPVQEKIPTGNKTSFSPETGKPINEVPVNEIPKVEQPKVDTNSPEFKQKVKESYDKLNEANPEEFNAKTHEVYANKFALDFMSDPAKVERIALGIEQHPDGAAFSDAYNALLSNEASKAGNIDLIEKLSDSSVGSISGQKLEANKLRLKDTVVDVIKKVKQGKFNELPNAIKKVFEKETSTGKKFINNEMTTFKPTKEMIGELVDSLICK